jgi:hypothetical protein
MYQPGPTPVFHDREQAREYRMREMSRAKAIFCTYPDYLTRQWAIWGLWWIDCAPEGANHILAPLQGKDGRPMGVSDNNENLGPNQALREARRKRGLNPFNGEQLVNTDLIPVNAWTPED